MNPIVTKLAKKLVSSLYSKTKFFYQYVHNKGSDNSSSLVFNNVNTRITYSPKSKSYDFFVDALNITGNKFQVRNFQNELSTSINQTMILPRQILIGLRYRL
jgi:hypothetical protein